MAAGLARSLYVSIAFIFTRAVVAVGAEGASAQDKFENRLERGNTRGDYDDVGLDTILISIFLNTIFK